MPFSRLLLKKDTAANVWHNGHQTAIVGLFYVEVVSQDVTAFG